VEIYFEPGDDAVTERARVLEEFTTAGLKPAAQVEDAFWVVAFEGTPSFVSFQERDGKLAFATLDQPLLEDPETPHAIFRALEDMGWRSEDESVG
jgi:hypothetical protein